MRQLKGVYTQRFNRNHNRVGHVFQGRYKAILVQKDSYLLELSRYIVLNPVRAGMVRSAKDWPWSSYRSTAGISMCPPWLHADWLLSAFSRRENKAVEQYCVFVAEGKNQPSPWKQLKNQIYSGDDDLVDEMQSRMAEDVSLDEIPSIQKHPVAKPLSYYQSLSEDRSEVIYLAVQSGCYSMKARSDYFGLHYSSVSKIVKSFEDSRLKTWPRDFSSILLTP